MLKGSALNTRENSHVEQMRHHAKFSFGVGFAPGVFKILAHHDHSAARTTERLVRGGGHKMAVWHGVVEKPARNQTRGMAYVCKKQCANLVGNAAKFGVVQVTAVGTGAANYHFWLLAPSDFANGRIMQRAGLAL